jgi:quercetin dioxygenase-like cupin family protein
MKVHNYRQVEGRNEAPGVALRVVAGPEEGATNFVMRVLEVQPKSSTPYHSHNWEHEVFILSGRGVIKTEDGERQLSREDVVFIPANEKHCFTNTGDELLSFICVIPLVS